MTIILEALSEVCNLLGGLLLEGADTDLLARLRDAKAVSACVESVGGALGSSLVRLQAELERGELMDVAVDYTRLMVTDATAGARGPLPVPPWEDCHHGHERQVMGERGQAAFRAYVSAGLGFDDMTTRPADHIGLELCFVAALLMEEVDGERDDRVRAAFVREHLDVFAPRIGGALANKARCGVWTAVGLALIALSPLLRPKSGRGVPVLQDHPGTE